MSEKDKEIQKYVDMIREKLTPLVGLYPAIIEQVGTLLAAIDEVTGKEPT